MEPGDVKLFVRCVRKHVEMKAYFQALDVQCVVRQLLRLLVLDWENLPS